MQVHNTCQFSNARIYTYLGSVKPDHIGGLQIKMVRIVLDIGSFLNSTKETTGHNFREVGGHTHQSNPVTLGSTGKDSYGPISQHSMDYLDLE